jgi:hypothetical protein
MRSIGLDIHRDFCEVAIAEAGRVRAAGRIGTAPAEIEAFAGGLRAFGRAKLARGRRAGRSLD